jgi:serine/threonine protein kinase
MTPVPNPTNRPSPDAVDYFSPPPEGSADTRFLGPSGDTSAARPAAPQTKFGTYRAIRELGAGGMGVVYEAEDEWLHRRVALKVLRADLPAEQRARERFLREARAMAAVDDDHVVHIYQVGEENGRPYMAMQLLEGETLESRLRRESRLPPPEAARIGREIALGLAEAHAKGLIHRDVKPANVWLESPNGRVKLLDFGLALHRDTTHLTTSGFVIGTPTYMSPEQSRGETLDGRTDLFSLGAILYQMTTGDRPFDGPNALAVVRNLEFHQPGRVNVKRPEVPAAFSNLIMELLAKNPKDRPPSSALVAERLARPEITRQPRLPIAPVGAPVSTPGPSSPTVQHPAAPRSSGPIPAAPSRARSGLQPVSRPAPPVASGSGVKILFVLAALAVGIGAFWYYEIANFGRLTVEAPADAEVRVLQNGVVRYTSVADRRFELRPGGYDLVLVKPANGYKLSRTHVDIRRDASEVVRVVKGP